MSLAKNKFILIAITAMTLLGGTIQAFASSSSSGVVGDISKLWHGALTDIKNEVHATNPVNVSTTPNGGLPAQTTVGNSYAVSYTLTNNLPFPVTIINVASSAPQGYTNRGFTVNTSACNNTTLAHGSSCVISVQFKPTENGKAAVQVGFQYHNNVINIPVLSSTAQGGAGNVVGAVTESLPSNTVTDATYPVQFTFTNTGNIAVSGSAAQSGASSFTISSNTCGASINPNSSCTVSGTFTPSATGETNVGVTYTYSGGSVPLETHTVVYSSSGGCASVNGSTALLLPSQTYIYADNVVKFIFTNSCSSASATLGTVNLSANLGSSSSLAAKNKAVKNLGSDVSTWVVKGSDTCSGQTLAANTSCSVLASMVPNATGSNLLMSAAVNYSQSGQSKQATASTVSSVVSANDSTNRMITVVNQCPYNVWMTFVPAAVPNVANCTTLNNCPVNSTCLTSANAGAGLCYWNNPTLDTAHANGFLAQAQNENAPDTVSITVPETNGGPSLQQNILYNAGIAARLNCTGTGSSLSCTVNNCGGTANPAAGSTGSDGMCTPGIGVSSSPGISYNAVEFTFLRAWTTGATDGVYDEQTINGVNVPMEMKGRGPANVGTAPYYNCPGAGAVIQPTTGSSATQLGACSYNYVTPAGYDPANYQFVTPAGSTACDQGSPCTSGTCGIAYTGAVDNKLTRLCGTFQGYVSVNTAICSQGSSMFSGENLYNDYSCGTGSPSTNAQLYACSGGLAGVSCYTGTSGTEATCCGCQDWWQSPTNLTVPTSTKSCGSFVNSNWTGTVRPQIAWVKTACPTAYSYQYDDESSQFYCTVTNNSSQIVTNYQVTFCPGGKSLPST